MSNRILTYPNQKSIIEIICYLYIGLFLYAAASKLIGYEKSQLQLSKSPITTDYANILVWLVPTIEIIISVLLFIPTTKTIALYAALALMSMFTAYIYAILNFSSSIPCSCGGVLETLDWDEHLIFNICFMILAIIAILMKNEKTEQPLVPIPV